MLVGAVKERTPETRVAIVPDNVKVLKSLNVDIQIERQAGLESLLQDSDYENAGAVLANHIEILSGSDVVVFVNYPLEDELDVIPENRILIGCFNPFINRSLVDKLMERRITSFSLELLPRTTLAQSMDILSSMSLIAGYKAVLEAAMLLPRFFPMFMTAAGTIKPARMLILGAGVAGLQAIATGRRLGARVEVFDVRSAAKEEVFSLGGRFIEVDGFREDTSAGGYALEQHEDFLRKQAELIHQHAIKSDVIICTAQIPGKIAPLLLKEETVRQMIPGSIIVDLAAASGGNCELTKKNEIVNYHGIKILGRTDYPVSMPADASMMYGNNITSFLKLILDTGDQPNLDWDNEIIRETCLTYEGKIINTRMNQLHNTSLSE